MKLSLGSVKNFVVQSDWSLYLFYIFVFSVPFWRRIELYTDYSYLEGRFVDYLTYSLYGFEFVALLAIVVWFMGRLRSRKRFFFGSWPMLYSFALLLVASLFSLKGAEFVYSGLYYIIVLAWLFLIYFFIINKVDDDRKMTGSLVAVVLSGVAQSLVAVGQFAKNGYLGLHFLGEQLISIEQEGVAKIVIDGVTHIRSYGTFSHPNALAFFLIFSGLCALHLFFKSREGRGKYIALLAFILLAISLLLSFSRVCWIIAFVLWVGYFLHSIYKGRAIDRKLYSRYLMIVAGVVLLVVASLWPFIVARINPFLSTTWESWEVRSVVIGKSWDMIQGSFFGVGIGNFMIEIAYLLTGYPVWMAEPVHNTFLLVWAEIGIFGLVSFLAFFLSFWQMAERAPLFLRYTLVAVFLIMFFDHGFWDIRQMQMVMFLAFGMIGAFYVNRKLSTK